MGTKRASVDAFTRRRQEKAAKTAKPKSSSNKKPTLKFSSINPKTGKVIVTDSGIEIKQSSRSRRRTSTQPKIITSMTDTRTGITTVKTSDTQGKIITKQIKPSVVTPKNIASVLRSRGVISAPDKLTLRQRIEQSITPRTTDSQVTRGVRGGGKFVVEAVEGIINIFNVPTLERGKKTTERLTTYRKALLGDKKSKSDIKNKFNNLKTGVSAFGAGLGQQLQSPDPFFKVQGLLTLGSLVAGPKITKAKKANVLFSSSKYSSKVNLVSKSAKTTIKTTGTLEDGVKFKSVTTLRHNPAQKTVIGQVKTTVKGKTTTQKVNLKDLGTTFVDSKTRKPVSKDFRQPKSIKYNIEELKTTGLGRDSTRIAKGEVLVTGKRIITKKRVKGKIFKGKPLPEVIRTKESVIDFATDFKGKPIDILTVRKSVNAQLNKLKAKDLKNLKPKDLKALENKLNNKVRTVIKRKGTAKVKGEFEQFGSFQVSLGPTRKLKANFKPLSMTRKNNLSKIPKNISIPKLKSKIKLTETFKLRKVLAPVTASTFINKFKSKIKQLEKGKLKDKIKSTIQPQKKKSLKKVVSKSKVKSKLKAQKTTKVTKQITRPVSKPVSKVTTKVKTRVFPPIIRLPIKIKAPVKLFIPFSNLQRTKNSRQGYVIKIKKGNKVIAFTTQPLPRVRALNFARTQTDNTIGASHSITKKGKTFIKDVTKTIKGNKFRKKRSKSTKVQIEVEKRKFRLDKRREKKGIKSVKVSKKKKKSSNKKRKANRKSNNKKK